MFSGQFYEKSLSVRERNMKLLLETVTYIAIKERVTCIITIETVMQGFPELGGVGAPPRSSYNFFWESPPSPPPPNCLNAAKIDGKIKYLEKKKINVDNLKGFVKTNTKNTTKV